jgi:murein L,D-transpeptidase YcbB/YkuD
MAHCYRIFLVLLLFGTLPPLQAAPATADSELETALDELLQHHPAELLGLTWHDVPLQQQDHMIATTYHEFGLRPLWVSSTGPGSRARAIYETLQAAGREGLNPEDYKVSLISQLWQSREARELAELDILLTTSLIEYLADLHHGRVQPQNAEDAVYYHDGVKDIDAVAMVKAALESSDIQAYLAEQLPRHERYHNTRKGLERYRQIVEAGGWPIIADGKTIHPGESDERMPVIRKRLHVTGDLDRLTDDAPLYDDATVEAVKQFQLRHGLKDDGVIGKGTLDAMNVTAERRVRQIELNLERWRWMSHDLGDKHVLVDIPAYEAATFEKNKEIYNMRVIVGKHHHETPVFSDSIKYIVINPYWTITANIARKEMLPKLRKDPGYLKKKNISLFRGWADDKELDATKINWNEVSGKDMRQYRLRQNPGPGNALGTLKIVFPNKYSVYMHDTPNHALFERSERSFSHGCIRMSTPAKQAAIVLGGEEAGWNEERIAEIVKSGERTVVRLPQPMNVHLSYQTAWADDDHRMYFVADVYGRDKKLEKALYGS